MSPALVERRRVRAHLEGALRAARSAPPPGLSRAQRRRRRALLRALARYVAAGRYPRNRVAAAPTPVFVDERGAPCAVAALLAATGDEAIARRVARDHNLARVPELAGDAELAAWLARNGLTLAEAARIQPMYHAYTQAHWQPTVSVVAQVAGGADTSAGTQLTLSPAVRAGVRRVEEGSTNHGNSVYGSLALTAEYAFSGVVGVGGAHRVGLVLQWEPDGNSRDVQWFLLGGPLAELDDDDGPGTRYGGQLGAGFSFRRRSLPLLFELVAVGLGNDASATIRLGAHVGLVW